jgi:outer membrane receptor for ferrienterochelin and colicin
MKNTAYCFFLLFMCGFVQSQNYTISGYIEDASSGEKLIGANVYDKKTFKGSTSNVYGFYSLTLPKDSVELVVSFVGFQPQTFCLYLDKDLKQNVSLSSSIELKTVEIVASQSEAIQEKSQMSSIVVPMEQIKALPSLLGERDVLKILQLLPGVQSGGEGTSGLYVRGGGPDQNLILLDGVPVYNASHLFGFFSVFNPDALNHVELIKGGFPARYGGRLSSVIDIRMKEGNTKKFKGEGSVGLVASKLTLEGPIIKDKTSFIVSGRRTYIDILTQPIIRAASRANGTEATAGYYFYDMNAKINHKFSDNSRLFLSAYMGNDKFYARSKDSYLYDNIRHTVKNEFGLGWGNLTTALRWNKIVTKKLFSNTTLTYSRYRFYADVGYSDKQEGVNINQTESFNFRYLSGIHDWAGKADFDYLPNPNHSVKFGIGNIYHTFTPGINTFRSSGDGSPVDTTFGAQRIYAHEFSTYAEDDIKMGARLKANIGIHFSGFNVSDTTYFSLQPRVSSRYLISESWSAKASYATMTQYLHLLTNASIGLPTDLWLPVTRRVIPQQSEQYATGLAYTYKNDYEISLEGYYKKMKNLIEYKDGASFFDSNTDWQDKIEVGKGWSYGAEVFVQRKVGKTTGWIGYTLSWTNRQFENLNFGKVFPYRYDRRHDIGIAITHKMNDKVDFGIVWVYGTGNAVTLPTERYIANDLYNYYLPGNGYYNTIENFDSRNGFRMPSYHRLDVSVNFKKEKKWGEAEWSLGLYNAYSRRNPFYLYIGTDDFGNRKLKQVSLFPIIPFISYNFKF